MMASDVTSETAEEPAGKGGQGRLLILSLVASVLFGAGGFALAYLGGADTGDGHDAAPHTASEAPEFVPIERMIVSLGPPGRTTHLRFAAAIEVPETYRDEVTALRPRIVDVLNSYLRAVDLDVLGDPAALVELRAQMLRRVQVVAGPGRVNDLLIAEFVLD
jgi:flagellar FliL protein